MTILGHGKDEWLPVDDSQSRIQDEATPHLHWTPMGF